MIAGRRAYDLSDGEMTCSVQQIGDGHLFYNESRLQYVLLSDHDAAYLRQVSRFDVHRDTLSTAYVVGIPAEKVASMMGSTPVSLDPFHSPASDSERAALRFLIDTQMMREPGMDKELCLVGAPSPVGQEVTFTTTEIIRQLGSAGFRSEVIPAGKAALAAVEPETTLCVVFGNRAVDVGIRMPDKPEVTFSGTFGGWWVDRQSALRSMTTPSDMRRMRNGVFHLFNPANSYQQAWVDALKISLRWTFKSVVQMATSAWPDLMQIRFAGTIAGLCGFADVAREVSAEFAHLRPFGNVQDVHIAHEPHRTVAKGLFQLSQSE